MHNNQFRTRGIFGLDILPISLLIVVPVLVFISFGTSCKNSSTVSNEQDHETVLIQTDENIPVSPQESIDSWYNHSPMELNEKILKEKLGIPMDSILDMGTFCQDSDYWPLFIIESKGIPCEYKEACTRFGKPSVNKFMFRFNKRPTHGWYWSGLDWICLEIINRYVTQDDPVWCVVMCTWRINIPDHCFATYYRQVGRDSLRLISAEFYKVSLVPG